VDRANTGSEVWADTAYRSRRNEAHMAKRGLSSKVHFRKPLPAPRAKANAARSKVRSGVEHVFAHQKGPMALFVRTIGIARARIKIGMANLVYNMRRLVWWERRTAPA
jgi:IS5 family transposase